MQIQKLASNRLNACQPLTKLNIPTCSFILFPLLVILILGSTRLSCQRAELTQGSCALEKTFLFSKHRQQFSLSYLKKAIVARSDKADLETQEYSYRVMLLMPNSEVPLTSYYSGGEGIEAEMKAIAAQINHFITTPSETKLDVRQDKRSEWFIGSIPFFVFGFIYLISDLTESFSTCVFDRDSNRFTLIRKKWFRCTEVVEHPLEDIAMIKLETSPDDFTAGCRVSVILKSGDCIPLTQGYYQSCNYHQTVSVLRQFLNLS